MTEERTQITDEEISEVSAPVGEKSEVSISVISPHLIEHVWAYCKAHVKRAIYSSDISQRLQTPNDVKRLVSDGSLSLWMIFIGQDHVATAVLGVEAHDRANVCTIYYTGGDRLAEWCEHFYDEVVERSREANCRFVRIEGRQGWVKTLNKLGFKKTSDVYHLEI